jgi:hypothetical protein
MHLIWEWVFAKWPLIRSRLPRLAASRKDGDSIQKTPLELVSTRSASQRSVDTSADRLKKVRSSCLSLLALRLLLAMACLRPRPPARVFRPTVCLCVCLRPALPKQRRPLTFMRSPLAFWSLPIGTLLEASHGSSRKTSYGLKVARWFGVSDVLLEALRITCIDFSF